MTTYTRYRTVEYIGNFWQPIHSYNRHAADALYIFKPLKKRVRSAAGAAVYAVVSRGDGRQRDGTIVLCVGTGRKICRDWFLVGEYVETGCERSA